MIYVIKGEKLISAAIGFVEVLIWFLIVREALNTELTSLWIAISYAGGYATGTLIGGFLSDRLISGNLTVQVILSNRDNQIITDIRKAGYAATVIDVKGQDEEQPKYMLLMEINKRRVNDLKKLIKSLDEKAFIVVSETKNVQNGYFK
jgi:uncharacterized protein YebE (UPF0316 family)